MASSKQKRQIGHSPFIQRESKPLDGSRYLAFSVAIIYTVTSILWIAYSDRLLMLWTASVEQLTELQTLKGWLFVGCTSLLLYGLIQRGVRQLQRKHKLLQNIIDSTNDAIFVKDRHGRYWVINKPGARILGLHPPDVLGKVDEQFFPAEEAQQIRSVEEALLEAGQPVEVEEALTLHGELRWFSTTKSLLLDERSRPIGIVGVARDVTQRKHTEEELRRSEQLRAELKLLENILEVTRAGYWDWDIPGNHEYLSPTFKRMLGYEAVELSSHLQTWQERIFSEDLPEVMECLNQHITSRGQTPFYNELRYRHRDGSTVWVICSGRVIEWGTDGSPLRMVGCNIDITDRKQAEEQLRLSNDRIRVANAELARAARLKDEFLANMSHELRTPLTSILGMSAMLTEEIYGALNEKQHQYIEVIAQSGNHLLNLINDILDLAKIESGKMTLEIAPTSIAALCSSSLNFVKQAAHQKNIRLETYISTDSDDIEVDERRMRQALINLLSNAVKFTPEGGLVRLQVTHSDVQRTVRFSVIDTGIGIAQEDIPKLFQSFVQIDSKLNRQYNGTGLGLALVKQITSLHEGTIEVTSTPAQGSGFTITLPISRRNAATPTRSPQRVLDPPFSQNASDNPPAEARTKPPRILLAEDNQANIDTFTSYLSAHGFQLIIARDGQEAIDLAKQHQPDLILMDIQMPGMDGLQATRQIRSDSALASVPIIALTALAMTGDREKCLAAGVTDYLAKPVKLQDLIAAIRKLLQLP